MQYRKDKKGNDISILGYGCMRFSRSGNKIDLDKAEKELIYAIDHGVNYLDTAYIYPGNEAAVGEILQRTGYRDKVYLATKLPHYMIRSIEGVEKTFQEELKRLRTDHIDYYLMHMLNDISPWNNLIKMGILPWIEEKLASGAIRNIGFSFHGNSHAFREVLDAYDWDFCQIQYNYMDEFSQAGREGLQYAASKKIPVIIMEPLRGGRLIHLLPEGAKEIIAADEKKRTAACLALSWLWNQPEVTCILSGMNSLEMVEENLKIASTVQSGAFDEYDYALIEKVKAEIKKNVKVGCTGCGYCMPCPQGVDIPEVFHCYNMITTESKSSALKEYLQVTAMRGKPTGASQCIQCGKCEQHCPQSIAIRENLKAASGQLETLKYRFVKWAVKVFKLY